VGTLAGWTYCPSCASPLHSEPGRVECEACGFVDYASSNPTASAVCEDEAGRILLVRRAHEPFAGCWDFPGGFVEEGEDLFDALRRELLEETGLVVEPGPFFGVWVDRYGEGDGVPTTLNLYWAATVVSGEPRPADDVAELRWFERDELPSGTELAFTTVALALERWRAQTSQRDR
jgi:ADP-ribose pyrophosphatase YjhB (NUDIX family)